MESNIFGKDTQLIKNAATEGLTFFSSMYIDCENPIYQAPKCQVAKYPRNG